MESSTRHKLFICAAICAALVLAGCGSGATTPVTDAAGQPCGQGDSACHLASVDGHASPTPEQIVPYRDALTALRPKCVEPEQRLVEFAFAGAQDLHRHRQPDSALQVLRELDRSVPPSAGRTSCQGALAAYLVLRERR